jgi:hypothetical protein
LSFRSSASTAFMIRAVKSAKMFMCVTLGSGSGGFAANPARWPAKSSPP